MAKGLKVMKIVFIPTNLIVLNYYTTLFTDSFHKAKDTGGLPVKCCSHTLTIQTIAATELHSVLMV